VVTRPFQRAVRNSWLLLAPAIQADVIPPPPPFGQRLGGSRGVKGRGARGVSGGRKTSSARHEGTDWNTVAPARNGRNGPRIAAIRC